MKKAHLFAAIITIVIFLISGLYMRIYFPEAYHNDQVMRAAFRTTHIYILFNSLCHLLLGTYLVTNQTKKRYILRLISSAFIMLASLFLIISFFYQAGHGEDSLRRFGVIITAIGVVGQALATVKENP